MCFLLSYGTKNDDLGNVIIYTGQATHRLMFLQAKGAINADSSERREY